MNPPSLPILFILDRESAFVFAKANAGNTFVLDRNEWEEIDKSDLSFHAIIILAELSWNGVEVQHDHGFSIGLELRRRYKCQLPIIITSAVGKDHFERRANNELQYKLLFARGTFFLPLLDAGEQLDDLLNTMEPIGIPVLTDMNEMLFNLRGVLSDSLSHGLQTNMDIHAFELLMSEMKALLDIEQRASTNWDFYDSALKAAIADPLQFPALKNQLLQVISSTLASVQGPGENGPVVRRHRLLVVEDNEIFAKELLVNLKDYFSEIILTDDAAEAIQLLKKDVGNSIVGLLCDWRLYSGPSKKYWQQQGYEVLDYAARNRYGALFGITSLSDTNVHNIRNILGFDLHLFKKEHFKGNDAAKQWEMMADIIVQKCDAIVQLIAAEPSGAGWSKLRNEYIEKRNTEFQVFETEISREASKLFSFYKEAVEMDKSRNVFSINEMGLTLKNNLKNVLIVRRVFLGLYALLNQRNTFLQDIRPASLLGDENVLDTGLRHHGIDAYSIMRKDWWDDIVAGLPSVRVEEEWSKLEQRLKNFRNVLCIDILELPKKGLLPEEKAWMINNQIDYSFLFNYWSEY